MVDNLIKLLVVLALSSTAYAKENTSEQESTNRIGNITLEGNKWKTYHVKSYDNITNIFLKINHSKVLSTLKADKELYKVLKTLKNGSIVRASTNKQGKLLELVLTRDLVNSFHIVLNKKGKYTGEWKKNRFDSPQSHLSFTIKNGLFFDGRKTGLSGDLMQQVIKVFDWGIDFKQDIRVGDKVTVVFEELIHQGEKVGVQKLITAEFINSGRKFSSFLYNKKDEKLDYSKFRKITVKNHQGNLITYVGSSELQILGKWEESDNGKDILLFLSHGRITLKKKQGSDRLEGTWEVINKKTIKIIIKSMQGNITGIATIKGSVLYVDIDGIITKYHQK